VNTNPTTLVIKVFLWVAIGVVVFYLGKSLLEPILFEREFEKRREAVIEKLKDIRSAQRTYKELHGAYAEDFNQLSRFIRTGSIPILRMMADSTDTTFQRQLVDTLREVRVMDSIFPGRPVWLADSIAYVPYSEGITFEMVTDEIVLGKVKVPVLEVSVAFKDFLFDLDPDLYDPEGGLSIGSLFEPSLNGNWE
jgi:hypothetical protein